jgi:esterase/lipase superfamily enzyme
LPIGRIGVITAGASIGAVNALAVLCRVPDAFTHAVCMSGT